MEKLLEQAIYAAIAAGKSIMEVYSTDFEVSTKEDNSPLTIADMRAHEIITKSLHKESLPVVSEEGLSIPYYKREQWQQFWLVDPLDGTKEFISRNGEFSVNIALVDNRQAVMGIIYAPVQDVLFFGYDKGAWRLDLAVEKLIEKPGLEKIIALATQIPQPKDHNAFTIVASRSHLNTETTDFINQVKSQHDEIRIVSRGSSLKLCMIAEGKADVYPRFGATSEWDTAAGHALVKAAGGKVVRANDPSTELIYNNDNMENPPFIAYAPQRM